MNNSERLNANSNKDIFSNLNDFCVPPVTKPFPEPRS